MLQINVNIFHCFHNGEVCMPKAVGEKEETLYSFIILMVYLFFSYKSKVLYYNVYYQSSYIYLSHLLCQCSGTVSVLLRHECVLSNVRCSQGVPSRRGAFESGVPPQCSSLFFCGIRFSCSFVLAVRYPALISFRGCSSHGVGF